MNIKMKGILNYEQIQKVLMVRCLQGELLRV